MKKYTVIAFSFIVWGATSCKKFLEEKPDKKLTTASSLQDLQAILDNNYVLNNGSGLALTASDEYYLTTASWNALSSQADKDSYTWQDNTQLDGEWNKLYSIVFHANTVLDALPKFGTSKDEQQWKAIKGGGLFFRAHAFYHIAQVFAKQFDEATASTDWGIPLRLSSDFHQPSVRASVQQTYSRVVEDLQEAALLLPVIPKNKLRPSRPAAFGLLARVFLLMRQYENAKNMADSCLQNYDTLVDFNTVNASAAMPLGAFNAEVIFHSLALFSNTVYTGMANIDTLLYQSYDTNDLRKQVYFSGPPGGPWSFKGTYYSDPFYYFNGIAVDEIYLIRAEANARLGHTTAAMNDLNTLMEKRWKQGRFIPFTAADPASALNIILEERRKELILRGNRWSDLKRLNIEPGRERTLKRVVNNQTYLLPPNDNHYAFLIPQQVINSSGMPQNPR